MLRVLLRIAPACASAAAALSLLTPSTSLAATGSWAPQAGAAATDLLRSISMGSTTSGLIGGGPSPAAASSYFFNGSVWSAGPAMPAGAAFLYDVSFVDATHAWAVGNPSSGTTPPTVVFYNGSTWTSQSVTGQVPNGFTLRGVDFVNSLDGWAVGTAGTILRTLDGGVTWTAQKQLGGANWTSNRLRDVFFLKAQAGCATVGGACEGWAVGDAGTILHTTDGGVTWSNETSGTITNLTDVIFPVDDAHGWITGGAIAAPGQQSNPVILRTTNGSAWADVTPAGLNVNTQLSGLSFTDNSNGWVSGADNTNTGFVLATTNGGTGGAWATSLTVASGTPLFDVQFLDSCHGWATGGAGTIEAFICPAPTPTPTPTRRPSPSPSGIGLPGAGAPRSPGSGPAPWLLLALFGAAAAGAIALGSLALRRTKSSR